MKLHLGGCSPIPAGSQSGNHPCSLAADNARTVIETKEMCLGDRIFKLNLEPINRFSDFGIFN